MPKFDYIIQNPPFLKSLHLDILKNSLGSIKKDTGKCVIIEPSTFYINIRKTGKAPLYDEIKSLLKGHVKKVIIENFNKEFNIGLYVPCSVTYVDFSKTYDEIEFVCCGYTSYVKSLYDCNLIGSYDMIWSIFNKVLKYKDFMYDHVYKPEGRNMSITNANTYYTKYADIVSVIGLVFSFPKGGSFYEGDTYYISTPDNKEYMSGYFSTMYHTNMNEISNTVLYSYDTGKNLTDKLANCLYDTKEHLETWKHFVFNNKLPLFLSICITIDQHNRLKSFIPWLVDKIYTDNEIYKLFNFTEDEIKFIDNTLMKFERRSLWFKRYVCGKDSVSNEEVQKYIELQKK